MVRGYMERSSRGGFFKDRHVIAVALDSPHRCSKFSKGASTERLQVKSWQSYIKEGLLFLSMVFFLVVIFKPGWFSLFSSRDTVLLITPVIQFDGRIADGSLKDSNSHLRPQVLTASHLKEAGSSFARPTIGVKDVVKDVSAFQQDHEGFANPLGLSNDMKVFIYDLPTIFNKDWLRDDRCSNHLFAAEVAVHQRLLDSPIRTFQPQDADYFFMPVYVSCNFNTTTGFPSLGHARSLLASAVKLVSRQMPFWNRSRGRDHIFVATHDYGPCFHTMEDLAVAHGIPTFLQNSIILQTFGRTDNHACQAKNSITIPPYVELPYLEPNWHPKLQHRDIWAFFRGKMEIHPKNVSGRIYSRGVRSTIWRKFRRNRRFFIKRSRSPDYQSEIQRSVFCLCPLGWAPWSPRIVESVIFGCVPVIIADKIALPYSHVIDWAQISITIPEKDVSKLGKILDKIAHTNLTVIQENLWNKKYRQAMLYLDPLRRGDATWHILETLSRKVAVKSHRSVHTF